MDNQAANKAWLAEETARRYQTFVEKTAMYQDLSRFMVELAGIEPGLRVLDLGCGTGVSTEAVLTGLENSGQVIAVDISGPMLDVAREKVRSNLVTFLEADAATVVDVFENEPPVDRVVCNSVFWQLRQKSRVLTGLRKIMVPDGLFVFNVPEPYFIFKHIPRSPKVSLLFKQLAAERYGVGQQDLRTMEVFLNKHGFERVATEEYTRVRSSIESYLFFQLPVATAWMDPPLDFETRLALLDEARQMAEPDKAVKQRWMYFVARPSH